MFLDGHLWPNSMRGRGQKQKTTFSPLSSEVSMECTCHSLKFHGNKHDLLYFLSPVLVLSVHLLEVKNSFSHVALVSHTLCPVFRVEYHSLQSLLFP